MNNQTTQPLAETLFPLEPLGAWAQCPRCGRAGFAQTHTCPPCWQASERNDQLRMTIYADDGETAAQMFARSQDAFHGRWRKQQVVYVWAPDQPERATRYLVTTTTIRCYSAEEIWGKELSI